MLIVGEIFVRACVVVWTEPKADSGSAELRKQCTVLYYCVWLYIVSAFRLLCILSEP